VAPYVFTCEAHDDERGLVYDDVIPLDLFSLGFGAVEHTPSQLQVLPSPFFQSWGHPVINTSQEGTTSFKVHVDGQEELKNWWSQDRPIKMSMGDHFNASFLSSRRARLCDRHGVDKSKIQPDPSLVCGPF